MKKFLIISSSLLALVVLIVVVVFFYVSSNLTTPDNSDFNIESAQVSPAQPGVSEDQQKALEKIGIDADNFVVTEAMVACAVEKVGAARVSEIQAGDAPSSIETVKLFPCLSAE